MTTYARFIIYMYKQLYNKNINHNDGKNYDKKYEANK